MKPKLFLCLALVFSGGLPNYNCHAAIIFPKQAEKYRAIAYQKTVSFYHDANPSFAPKNLQIDKLNVTNGFRWYWFDDRSVLSGKLLPPTDSTSLGWNYMIVCGTNMVGVMGLAWDTNHWSFVFPIYSGATLKGQQDPIWVALERAERLPQVKDKDYEFRYLTYANVDFPVIWLHGKSDDILIPISDGYGKWKAYKPYSEKQMVTLLKPEIKRDIAVWRKFDEEQRKNMAAYSQAMMDYEKAHGEKCGTISWYGMGPIQALKPGVWICTLKGKSSECGILAYKVKITFTDGACSVVKQVEILGKIKDGPNRYAPVTGQIDPWFPVKSMTNLPAAAPYKAKLEEDHGVGVSEIKAAPKVKLKFVRVDSEETDSQDGYGENAVDGNPNTYWHTQWHGNSPGLPHEIIIELLPPSVIKGFTYLPRQDESDHGTIKGYEFYVSDDGKTFGQPVKKGAFEPGKEEKIETFEPIKCRFIKLKAISEINGLPWTSAAEIRVIQSGEDTSVLTYQINQATSLLAEFEKNKSIEQLERAFRAVERIPFPGVDKTVQPTIARRELAKMWLNLLATIDQNIDPSFDVNDSKNLAAVSLIPPPTPEGIRYPSGVDPKEIKDPQTRAQYEAAIKENDEKKARGIFQTGLRNINELAVLDVGRFFPIYYTSSKEDQSELENLMQQAKLSPDRVQKLKDLFESTIPAGNDVDTNFTKQISGILYSKAPEDGRQITYEKVSRILQAFPRSFKGLRIEDLTIADPCRSYYVDLTDLASGKLLSAAECNGSWQYLLIHGTNAFGVAYLIADEKTGKALKCTGVSESGLSDGWLEALRIAERLPQTKESDYELRFLGSAPIYFQAVWLHGKSDDIIIPLPNTFGRWNAYQPYSESEMIKLLKPEAKKKLKEPPGMVD